MLLARSPPMELTRDVGLRAQSVFASLLEAEGMAMANGTPATWSTLLVKSMSQVRVR